MEGFYSFLCFYLFFHFFVYCLCFKVTSSQWNGLVSSRKVKTWLGPTKNHTAHAGYWLMAHPKDCTTAAFQSSFYKTFLSSKFRDEASESECFQALSDSKSSLLPPPGSTPIFGWLTHLWIISLLMFVVLDLLKNPRKNIKTNILEKFLSKQTNNKQTNKQTN